MKKMIIALAVAASLVAPTAALANDGENGNRVVMVSNLNVRTSPKIADNVAGVLHAGDMVDLKSKTDDGVWCVVDAKDWKGAFVACRYIGAKTDGMSAPSKGWIEINGFRMVGSSNLNVRSSAVVGNNRIGFFSKGDQVRVLEKSPSTGWCKVAFNKNGHEKGYVVCKYLMNPQQ